MKKNVCLIIFLFLTLSSCQDEESIHDGLYNAVCSYIYNRESDIYDFEEIGRYAQKTNKLSRDTDIYIIQDQIKDDVNSRLAVVAHTYFVKNAGINKFNRNNILEIEGKDLKVCPNPQYAELYLTQEEIDCVNRIYYAGIPSQLEMLSELESRKFEGYRYYYACKYRMKLSDKYKTRQFVVYENNNDYKIYELKYNYGLFRSYIRAISNVDMKDPYILSITQKKNKQGYDTYSKLLRRLNIDILDNTAINGY